MPPGTGQNWLALAMLGSMVLGMVRLGSGLWAIRRLRERSEPLADPALIETVALLRAEMSCASPSKFAPHPSWQRRPRSAGSATLILLPHDWQTWNDEERRAVLAHELAHVCRGDFLAGLLAQLSLAVQFYHPLAHWLSARLRLEQELAADAWSAQLTGGALPYLTTLAQMALRRDDRALSWPARAFLPSRGTFVRRIEMLRDSKRVRHVGLSARLRFLTVGSPRVARRPDRRPAWADGCSTGSAADNARNDQDCRRVLIRTPQTRHLT